MAWRAKVIFSDGDEMDVNDGELFASEEEATNAALELISCYHQGAEDLEAMGGNEGEIDYSEPEIETWEE